MLFAENTSGQFIGPLLFWGVMLIGFVRLMRKVRGDSPVAVAGRRAATQGVLRLFR